MFNVKKRTLLLIAGIVWFIAGFNIVRLGLLSYFLIQSHWYTYVSSVIIFLLFGMMFLKMSTKHTKRIVSYEDYRPFWHFFDLKAYIIMAFMMSMGIGFRMLGIFSNIFVAYFYSVLVRELLLAVFFFIKIYLSYTQILGQ